MSLFYDHELTIPHVAMMESSRFSRRRHRGELPDHNYQAAFKGTILMLNSKSTLSVLSFFCTSALFASSIHQSTALAQEDIDYPGLPGIALEPDPCLGLAHIPQPCPVLLPGQTDTCVYRTWRRTNTEYSKFIVKNSRNRQSMSHDPWVETAPCDCRYVYAYERRQCPTAQTSKSSETQFCWNLGAKMGLEVSGGTIASLAAEWGVSFELSSSIQSCKKMPNISP